MERTRAIFLLKLAAVAVSVVLAIIGWRVADAERMSLLDHILLGLAGLGIGIFVLYGWILDYD